jgi:hypothetical protein
MQFGTIDAALATVTQVQQTFTRLTPAGVG